SHHAAALVGNRCAAAPERSASGRVGIRSKSGAGRCERSPLRVPDAIARPGVSSETVRETRQQEVMGRTWVGLNRKFLARMARICSVLGVGSQDWFGPAARTPGLTTS